jgi:hypothetical protein
MKNSSSPLADSAEDLQIDRVRDRLMSSDVGMEVIPMVVGSQVLCWMGRVMRGGILIHDPIATAALAANKAVDLLPFLLLRRHPCSCAFERSQCRTDEADLSLVRPRDQSLQCSDQRVSGRRGSRTKIVNWIVGKYHPADIRLLEDVSLETILGTFARTVDEKPISTDSQIEGPLSKDPG